LSLAEENISIFDPSYQSFQQYAIKNRFDSLEFAEMQEISDTHYVSYFLSFSDFKQRADFIMNYDSDWNNPLAKEKIGQENEIEGEGKGEGIGEGDEDTLLSQKQKKSFKFILSFHHLPVLWMESTYSWIQQKAQSNEFEKVYGNRQMYLCMNTINHVFKFPEIQESFHNLTGKGIKIGLLDSGIDPSHPDLRGQVIDILNVSNEGEGDRNGHGTFLASIIAGKGIASEGYYKGIVPDAKLIDIKVFNRQGVAFNSEILIALDLILDRAPSDRPDLLIFGCSSGVLGSNTDLISKYCDLFVKENIPIVAPTGNFGPDLYNIGSPGMSNSVLCVGTVDEKMKPAFFSGRANNKPDIIIQGTKIISARAFENIIGKGIIDESQYIALTGTSISAAIAGSMLAILKQINRDAKPQELYHLLKSKTQVIDGLINSQGKGIPQLLNILTSTGNYYQKPLTVKRVFTSALTYSIFIIVILIGIYFTGINFFSW
jgi:serine protease AprX